jgi:hypothetical protein
MKMKIHTNTRILTLAAWAIAAAQFFAAAEVSAADYKHAERTGKGIAEFRDEILNIKKEADATMVALDKIMATAASDPRKAFKEYDSAVPRLEGAAEKARKRSEDMKARGQAYFKEWEKQLAELKNEDVRKLADERKAKLQTTFGEIRTTMEPVKEQFNAWLVDLKDLRSYLTMNLNLEGIDAAKDLMAKAKTEGQDVQKTLDKVIAELNTIVATLTPKVEPTQKK